VEALKGRVEALNCCCSEVGGAELVRGGRRLLLPLTVGTAGATDGTTSSFSCSSATCFSGGTRSAGRDGATAPSAGLRLSSPDDDREEVVAAPLVGGGGVRLLLSPLVLPPLPSYTAGVIGGGGDTGTAGSAERELPIGATEGTRALSSQQHKPSTHTPSERCVLACLSIRMRSPSVDVIGEEAVERRGGGRLHPLFSRSPLQDQRGGGTHHSTPHRCVACGLYAPPPLLVSSLCCSSGVGKDRWLCATWGAASLDLKGRRRGM
jgi:hypothetical protein